MTSLAEAPSNHRRARGFTLLEMMVVVALVLLSAAMVFWGFGAQKEREKLKSSFLEMRGLFAQARNHALATGNRVVVMVFPDVVTDSRGAQGRFIIYEDGDGTFFTDAPGVVHFGNYDPKTTRADARSTVVDWADLPFLVSFGPVDGWGSGTWAPAPYAGVPLDAFCTFCAGANRRGAVVFDPPVGAVSFYSGDGPPLGLTSAALSLTARDTHEVKTLLIGGNGSFRAMYTIR